MSAMTKSEETLIKLFKRGTHLTYKKGEYVIRPGESPPGIFFIESGLIKAYDITKYGEENLLIVRREGEIFPLIWAIKGQERHIIYEAICEASLWRIDRKSLLALIKSDPSVLEPLLDMTVEMYRIHSERIINLEYRTVRERLISFLLTMSARFGHKQPDGSMVIRVPLKMMDIASSINTTRETASREVNALVKKGLLHVDGEIILKDTKKLRTFLD